MTLSNLAIDLKELADEDNVKISAYNQCMGNAETQYINIGKFAVFECYDGSNTKWELHYLKYNNAYSVDVKVCEYEEEEDPIPCPNHSTQAACEGAGCYWYDGGCHSNPEEIPEGEDVDYERIKGDMEDSIAPVLTGIAGVDQAIKGVKALVNGVCEDIAGGVADVISGLTEIIEGVGDSLQDSIEGVLESVSDLINDMQTSINEGIVGVSEGLTAGFAGLGDKIDGLKFPTIDSIKEAFLAVCEELAAALWDRIIDEIEKRYPDDEEEED